MPDEMLKLDEIEKIAEKFVREHKEIDLNKQKIEFNRVELSSSNELGRYYEVEGKVENRYKSSSGYGDILASVFPAEKAFTAKESLFKLKISAKGGDVIDYNFKDIEPSQYATESQHVVGHVSVLGESPIKSVMDELDSISKIGRRDEEKELLREIKEDIRDRRKRRKRII